MKIAREYEEKYPEIIRVIDKENGGHGDAVNYGLKKASGKYFKVVDSDDWVREESLRNMRQEDPQFRDRYAVYVEKYPLAW